MVRGAWQAIVHGVAKNRTRLSMHVYSLQMMWHISYLGFPCGSAGKESSCNVQVLGSIPGLGRCPGEGKGSVQSLSRVWLFVTHGLQHDRPPYPSPTPGVDSDSCPLSRWCHLTILSCHPLLLLPSIFPSIRVFSNESVLCIRWPKYWSFSFSISPSNEYSGLISFRMDWLDLFTIQGKGYPLQYSGLENSWTV